MCSDSSISNHFSAESTRVVRKNLHLIMSPSMQHCHILRSCQVLFWISTVIIISGLGRLEVSQQGLTHYRKEKMSPLDIGWTAREGSSVQYLQFSNFITDLLQLLRHSKSLAAHMVLFLFMVGWVLGVGLILRFLFLLSDTVDMRYLLVHNFLDSCGDELG